jgi:hypothetical protein
LCYIVLHYEHIVERTIISLHPNLIAGRAIDQLGRDAHPIAIGLQTTLQHILNPEFARDLADIHGLALVDLGRITGDDK